MSTNFVTLAQVALHGEGYLQSGRNIDQSPNSPALWPIAENKSACNASHGSVAVTASNDRENRG